VVEEIPVIQDPMVRTGFILLGTIGGSFYLIMAVLEHRIIENMREDKETAIAKFFLKGATLRAFKILTVSGLALVLIMLTEIYAMIVDLPVLATTARIMYLLPMAGLIYFPYILQKVTERN
jgi:hypothetical protein